MQEATVNTQLYEKCRDSARYLIDRGYPIGDVSEDELTETLYKLEREKEEKNQVSDSLLDYNDEIVSIEDIGAKETIDISVSGDNLFYCNDILTKNSFGLPATADFMAALITSEDLESMGQLMVKQLKNRWGDISNPKRFVVGIDRSKMRLYDAEASAQENLTGGPATKSSQQGEKSIMDKSEFGSRLEDEMFGAPKKRKRNFKELK